MKRTIIFITALFLFLYIQPVYAQSPTCSSFYIDPKYGNEDTVFTYHAEGCSLDGEYQLWYTKNGNVVVENVTITGGSASSSLGSGFFQSGSTTISIQLIYNNLSVAKFFIYYNNSISCQNSAVFDDRICASGCIPPNIDLTVDITNDSGSVIDTLTIHIPNSGFGCTPFSQSLRESYGNGRFTVTGSYEGIEVFQTGFSNVEPEDPENKNQCTPLNSKCSSASCCSGLVCAAQQSGVSLCKPCEEIFSPEECIQSSQCTDEGDIDTAIGCISISSITDFLTDTTIWSIGIGGGLFIIIIAYSGYLMMTSQGDPRRLRTGQEILFSGIAGILLMIFGVLIIRLFDVNFIGI